MRDVVQAPKEVATSLLSLNDALIVSKEIDLHNSRIVEMKIFCGLSADEIAEVENVSISTIEREWRKAKAWLRREIR